MLSRTRGRTRPNECCGIVATQDGRAVQVFRATNAEPSPVRFEIDPRDQIRITMEIERSGWDLGVDLPLAHAEPGLSVADRRQLRPFWPGVVWLIVSLVDRDAPDVRAFRIAGAEIEEVPLTIE